MWNFISTITDESSIAIPIILIDTVKMINSNEKISNIMNNFFFDKMKKIVLAFKPVTYDPLVFRRNLIKKPKKRMIIPHISTDQVETRIRKSKNSSARGFNETSMKFLKITPEAWAPNIAFNKNKTKTRKRQVLDKILQINIEASLYLKDF